MHTRNKEIAVEVVVEEDLARMTEEELAEEERSFAERAERVLWRVYRNAPPAPSRAEAPAGRVTAEKSRGS
jgi:hypothetical protein